MNHHAVHSARPDVNCVAHSHSIYGRAFSSLGRNIDMIPQDSCAFYNDISVYAVFRGIVLEEEGHAIAATLGQKKAAVLLNHGLLTCAQSIEATVYWFVSLESACRAQLLADAAAGGRGGETIKIDDKDAATRWLGRPVRVIGCDFIFSLTRERGSELFLSLVAEFCFLRRRLRLYLLRH
jgi:ribulose-5-phosphate 4-epimerase/fuculose-1-phosphate aldolase